MNATGRSQELRRAVAKKEGARDHERERSWSKEKLKRRKKIWIEPFLSHLTKGSTTTGLCPIPCLCSEWTPCSGSKAPPSPFDCASVSPCRSPSHSSSRAGGPPQWHGLPPQTDRPAHVVHAPDVRPPSRSSFCPSRQCTPPRNPGNGWHRPLPCLLVGH